MKMSETHNSCEKTEPVLYRIGMFAAMNRVSVKTLRFYEEQGLISPTKWIFGKKATVSFSTGINKNTA